MGEIEELEKKWRRYKIKKFLSWIVYLGGVVVILLVAPIAYNSINSYLEQLEKKENKTPTTQPEVIAPKEPVAKKDIPVPEEVASIKPEKKKHVRPKLNIIVSNEPINGDDPSISANGIEFDKTVDNDTLARTIEARFQDTKDYDDAMFLAKYYYAKGSYKKAENWAMQANSIDSSKEESWIIFAKSKAKQGRRADALRVLQAYFDRTGSMRVKNLIDKIRRGKRF
jgi:tetratricopeptide (TPR) repeat protein